MTFFANCCRYIERILLINRHLKDDDKAKILQRVLLGEGVTNKAATTDSNSVVPLSVKELCSMTQVDMMSDAEKQITKQRQLEHMRRKMIDKNVFRTTSNPTRPKVNYKKAAKSKPIPKQIKSSKAATTEQSGTENSAEQPKASSSESTGTQKTAEKGQDVSTPASTPQPDTFGSAVDIGKQQPASDIESVVQTSSQSTSLPKKRSAPVEPETQRKETSIASATPPQISSAATTTSSTASSLASANSRTRDLETTDASTLQPPLRASASVATTSNTESDRVGSISPPSTSGFVSNSSSHEANAAGKSAPRQPVSQTKPIVYNFSEMAPSFTVSEHQESPRRRPPSPSVSKTMDLARSPPSMDLVSPPTIHTDLDISTPQYATATASRHQRDATRLPSAQVAGDRSVSPRSPRAVSWRGVIRSSSGKVPIVARHVMGWSKGAETSSVCALCNQPRGKVLNCQRLGKAADTIAFLSNYQRHQTTVIQLLEVQPDSTTEIGLFWVKIIRRA